MKNTLTAGAALLLTTSLAHAVGLDRSGQPIGIIFEEGGATGAYAELSYGYIIPDVEGADLAGPLAGNNTDNVADSYGQLGLGYKRNIDDQFSFALIIDEPYGADIKYDPANSFLLGDVGAELNSLALTGILRYKIDNAFSVHGGVRAQRIDADITLPRNPPGAPVQASFELDDSVGYGYVVGAAYERPEIALRVALTYFSEVDHEFSTSSNVQADETLDVVTPQAVNLDFQTGIAADTLLFGSVRWAEYSTVLVEPTALAGASITDVEDGYSFALGIGRRFSDVFSGSVSATFDTEGEDDLVSPLAPTNGSYSVGVAGQYEINENVTLSGGLRYIVVGDAIAAPGDVPAAEFEDNSVIAVGFKVGYNF